MERNSVHQELSWIVPLLGECCDLLSCIRPASWKVVNRPFCFEKVWESQDSLRSFVCLWHQRTAPLSRDSYQLAGQLWTSSNLKRDCDVKSWVQWAKWRVCDKPECEQSMAALSDLVDLRWAVKMMASSVRTYGPWELWPQNVNTCLVNAHTLILFKSLNVSIVITVVQT